MSLLNIAHRGLSSKFPENTMLAFDEALKAGADGFECDLRLSADGQVVVFHDDTLDRLCGISGSIEKSTWSEIQKFKVKKKEKIPKLEELLAEFSSSTMNLELKKSERPEVLVESVLRILTKHRPKGRILFSSFSLEILRCLRVMDPSKKMGELGLLVETSEIERLPEISKDLKPDTWNVPRQILNQPWFDRWKAVKLPRIWVWTLDEPDLWKSAQKSKLPIEAIITNKSDALHLALSS